MCSKSKEMYPNEAFKQQAADIAVNFVHAGMIVGLGSGSTASLAIQKIGEKLSAGELENIHGIPCSIQSEEIARRLGIPLTTLEKNPIVDLTIDGADEIDPYLNLIKGGGGALLREKIVAQASCREIIIIDETKLSPVLGTNRSLPLEVLPFGWGSQVKYVESLGADCVLRKNPDNTIYKTNQENLILDCHFGPIENLERLSNQLSKRSGIIEHGLFIGLASDVIVVGKNGCRYLKNKSSKHPADSIK